MLPHCDADNDNECFPWKTVCILISLNYEWKHTFGTMLCVRGRSAVARENGQKFICILKSKTASCMPSQAFVANNKRTKLMEKSIYLRVSVFLEKTLRNSNDYEGKSWMHRAALCLQFEMDIAKHLCLVFTCSLFFSEIAYWRLTVCASVV